MVEAGLQQQEEERLHGTGLWRTPWRLFENSWGWGSREQARR